MNDIARPDPLLRIVLLGAGLVIIAAGLRAAAPIVNAVLLAALLALTLLPAKQALMRRGLSRSLAVLIVLAAVFVGGALLVGAIASAIADFSAQAPQYEQQLAGLMGPASRGSSRSATWTSPRSRRARAGSSRSRRPWSAACSRCWAGRCSGWC